MPYLVKTGFVPDKCIIYFCSVNLLIKGFSLSLSLFTLIETFVNVAIRYDATPVVLTTCKHKFTVRMKKLTQQHCTALFFKLMCFTAENVLTVHKTTEHHFKNQQTISIKVSLLKYSGSSLQRHEDQSNTKQRKS